MTTQDIEDPFAGANPDDDEFATPVRNFLSIEDLDGRLVIAFPHSIDTLTSPKNGKDYQRIIADVVVVDGKTTDKLPKLPHLATDMHLSATGVVASLRAMVGKGRPVLGRVDSRPSSFNKNVPAYGLADPTDADKAAARPALAQYRAGQFA